jgi:hypothetical protein
VATPLVLSRRRSRRGRQQRSDVDKDVSSGGGCAAQPSTNASAGCTVKAMPGPLALKMSAVNFGLAPPTAKPKQHVCQRVN